MAGPRSTASGGAPDRRGEISFQRRREHVTAAADLDASRVPHAGDGRRRASLETYFAGLTPVGRARIEVAAMDMRAPHVRAVERWVPEGGGGICSDRFHATQHPGRAVGGTGPAR